MQQVLGGSLGSSGKCRLKFLGDAGAGLDDAGSTRG